MFYKLFCAVLLIVCALCQPAAVQAKGITNYPALVNADYWLKQNKAGGQVLLNADGIKRYNSQIRETSSTVVDLQIYPDKISGDSLKTKIMNYQVLEDDLYLHGNKVSDNYKNILRTQTNIKAVPSSINVRYAVTVRRTPIRNLPTGEGLFYYAADHDFDALQETCLDPGEPVAVLHASANGYFYYVQSYNYSGWISKFNLGFTDKKTWLQYVAPKSFLVVTDADCTIKVGSEQLLYQQGARLPIIAEQSGVYTVEVPMRNANGALQKQKADVLKTNKAVHKGYLPYTSNNIVCSAFKFYGRVYGWGGLKNSVDCSALVLNAYRTVGIYLPRNSDEQEATAGTKNLLESLDRTQKTAVLKDLRPGACLYMDGHVVLYIGQINGDPYTIHALGSCFTNGKRQREMKVVVSDLSLQRSSGNTFLDDIYTAMEFL